MMKRAGLMLGMAGLILGMGSEIGGEMYHPTSSRTDEEELRDKLAKLDRNRRKYEENKFDGKPHKEYVFLLDGWRFVEHALNDKNGIRKLNKRLLVEMEAWGASGKTYPQIRSEHKLTLAGNEKAYETGRKSYESNKAHSEEG